MHDAIDVHAHCVPPDLPGVLRDRSDLCEVDRGSRGGWQVRFAGEDRTVAIRPDLLDLDARFAAMERCGVGGQVLSGFVGLLADQRAPGRGGPYARLLNEALAGVVAGHPDRFRAMATVPAGDPAAAAGELEYAVTELGLVGVEVSATPCGPALDELDALWEAAAGLGALVLVHPTQGGGTSLPYGLDNFVGNPAESTAAVARMIFRGVFERHPALRVCVPHGGGFLPWQAGRLDRGHATTAAGRGSRLAAPPSRVLPSLWYDTVLHSPDLLAVLVARVGASQVLLGSDYPFEMGDPDPVGTVAAVPGLSGADRQAIRAGNARQLLKF